MKNQYLHQQIYFIAVFLCCILYLSCQEQSTQGLRQAGVLVSDTIPKAKNPIIKAKANTVFPQIHTNLRGMVSEFVRIMYQDKKGDFWFGTNGDGVIHYDGKSLAKFVKKDGLGGIAVRGIVEDAAGNIWFGTSGGLTKYDGKRFTNFSQKDGLIHDEIWDIELDQQGTIWIATVEGVSKFDGKVFTDFPIPRATVDDPAPMLSYHGVFDILADRKGNIWFLSDGYGICIFDGKNFSHLTKKNGLADNNVSDILEDRQGNFWIGTFYGGVSRYDGKNFINYTQDGLIEGIETYNFCEDKAGNIWFAAEGVGVYRFDGQSFARFTTEDGLTTNGVQSIFLDQKGQLWFGTWKGICIYDGQSFADAAKKEAWTE